MLNLRIYDSMKIKKNCCCFTGHRIILSKHRDVLPQNLSRHILQMTDMGIYNFMTGGALGFDTLAAKAILKEREKLPDIHLILALPCKNQTRGWRQAQILEYEEILKAADEVIFLADEYYDGCLLKRNRFMIDNSSHCIFYISSMHGGTAYTIKYAEQNNVNLHNVLY